MSSDRENGNSPDFHRPRRPSFNELFGGRGMLDSSTAANNAKNVSPAMASAMAQQAQQSSSQSRRLSITTLGLSGSPPNANPPTSPFGSMRRGYSMTDGGRRPSMDENEDAVDDVDPTVSTSAAGSANATTGGSPFGRRVSFGALGYNTMRSFSVSSGGGGDGSNVGTGTFQGNSQSGSNPKPSSPPANRSREGFDWSENLRKRAERTSISAASGGGFLPLTTSHNRTKSGTPSTGNEPTPTMPTPKPTPKAPDHFQERILKGDFYMD